MPAGLLPPLGIRADALLLGTKVDADYLSYNVNAVATLPLPLVQPYAIAGRGRYVIAPALAKEMGWNYGAGVRVGVSRLGAFVEMRRHEPLQRRCAHAETATRGSVSVRGVSIVRRKASNMRSVQIGALWSRTPESCRAASSSR